MLQKFTMGEKKQRSIIFFSKEHNILAYGICCIPHSNKMQTDGQVFFFSGLLLTRKKCTTKFLFWVCDEEEQHLAHWRPLTEQCARCRDVWRDVWIVGDWNKMNCIQRLSCDS